MRLNLGLHREQYLFEWTRKEQLESSANLLVALLTVLAGGVLFLVQTFPYAGNLSTTVFSVLATGSGVFQIAGIYFLIRSLHGNWYEQIPSSDKLQAYFEELEGYHEALSGGL